MPEGRVVFKDGEYILEYHFKDHLGNLRLAFQVTDQQSARYALTMEADSAKSEEAAFSNVKVARTDQKEQKGEYSARLTNAEKPISKTIQVKKGDKISAFVFATNDPEIAQTDPNKPIAEAKKELLLSLGSAAVGVINTNPTQQEIDIPLNPEVSPAQTIITKSPKVQLNLLDFIPVVRNLRKLNRAKRAKELAPDSYHVPRGELVVQLRDSTDSLLVEKRQKITISAISSWQKLASELTVEQDGNLTVFIDNQDTEPVYFDELELRVERTPTLVITQEHHYYPFGMNMTGIERDGELKYQFNGMVEKEQAFGLELYETPFRSYDAQLGRFWQVEPLADIYCGISLYQFGYNNPVSFNDPSGLSVGDGKEEKEEYPRFGDPFDFTPIDGRVIGDYSPRGSSGSKIGGGGYTWDLGNTRGSPYSMGGTPGQGPGDRGGNPLSNRGTRERDRAMKLAKRYQNRLENNGYDFQSLKLNNAKHMWAASIAFDRIAQQAIAENNEEIIGKLMSAQNLLRAMETKSGGWFSKKVTYTFAGGFDSRTSPYNPNSSNPNAATITGSTTVTTGLAPIPIQSSTAFYDWGRIPTSAIILGLNLTISGNGLYALYGSSNAALINNNPRNLTFLGSGMLSNTTDTYINPFPYTRGINWNNLNFTGFALFPASGGSFTVTGTINFYSTLSVYYDVAY